MILGMLAASPSMEFLHISEFVNKEMGFLLL